MKKIIVLLCLGLALCGCGKESKEDTLKDFQNKMTSAKSYKVTGNMEISNDEETFTYSLESYYLKDDYYKVVLVNQTNNHEQIILKSNDDIYVITPSLNKSFKFQSDWPGNSSQAYLLGSLVTDIANDKDVDVSEVDDGYIIKTKVNYPNNEELKYEKIYLDKNKVPEKVEVYNENDIVKIKVTFGKVDLKAGLKETDFKLEDYLKEEENNCEGTDCKENSNSTTDNKTDNKEENKGTTNNDESDNALKKPNGSGNSNTSTDSNTNTNTNASDDGALQKPKGSSNTTANIDTVIYPLYIPSNTYLTHSETIDLDEGNRVILTFGGEKNFVLIEEKAKAKSTMEIIPVYGEPLVLSETVGAISANSLSFDVNDISYYLASTELSKAEMQLIANSLGNATLVAGIK